MTQSTFVLGADDPEMSTSETLLRECGQRVRHAMVASPDGTTRRVTPRDAYQLTADQVTAFGFLANGPVVLVECDCAGYTGDVIRIDHHRPGDVGFGRPPAQGLTGIYGDPERGFAGGYVS